MGLRWNKNECYGGGGGGFIPLYRFAVNKQTNKQTNSGAHSRVATLNKQKIQQQQQNVNRLLLSVHVVHMIFYGSR